MKRITKIKITGMITAFLVLQFFCSALISCSTLGLPSGKGWTSGPKKIMGTAELGTIRVDKNEDWDSVEAEAKRLLPLLLAEQGYVHGTAYRVNAVLIDREYMENWKTRRSLTAEIRIWKSAEYGEEKIPLAAGRALLSGKKSLSSSKVLHDLLKLALSRALKALPK
jgi:hypothetical protein